ncbi:MAG TPA: LysM peptidoglycan-binding domain-containing protein [Puia sp.]|nr:LysM peptidoglycan-binding domain-containing protein [Puia sp.]
MKSLIACLLSLVLTGYSVFAQHAPLQIEGTGGKFYLVHTVVAKDNWYSIGRLYNAPPHDIASFNNMSFDKPLDIGRQINIPLTAANFDQKQKKSSGESLIPVYHTVQDREWAFKLSSIYNDVPVTSLEKWNKVKRDDIRQGMNLVVGYLRVKDDQSAFASAPPLSPDQQTAFAATQPEKPAEAKVVDQPAQPSTAVKTSPPPTVSTASNTSSDRVNTYAASHPGGFFSNIYLGSGNKSISGQAGTFKSTSGWNDGKYYALMNGVPVGTIIRVVANGKSVYAKVLGQLPDMKESAGLITRISNAASAELGAGEGRFQVEIRY